MKAAAIYAERFGWAVIPLHSVVGGVCSCVEGAACKNAGKHPRIREWQDAATDDAAQIAEWIAKYPTANVGVATGEASGFWVLDVDGAHGAASLAALLEAHGQLPETATAITGSGGTHYLFALPDFKISNSASKVALGIDVRGAGGQIVVAPSVSAKGPYRWKVPPNRVPPAPAPDWLLGLVRAPARSAAPTAPVGDFPPASPEVIAAARDALEQHGPAVEGNGGDEHTFIAAALLVHDFALTDEEAWPLLVEWNATCLPPWSESDLAAKMRGGAKYGTRAKGCRRALDSKQMVEREIEAWRERGSKESEIVALVERTREIVRRSGDPTRKALIERELVGATGLKPRALALPDPDPTLGAVPEGTIIVTPRLHEVADKATAVLVPHVFARSGVLCEVVKAERTFISDLEPSRVLDLMSRHSDWAHHDGEEVVTQAPPMPVAQIVAARRTHRDVRVIEAVATSPVFLANGEILQARGYSAQARVFLEPNVTVDVPEEPTRDDARKAALVLRDLVCDFRFLTRADFSAWVAGLLSPLVKSATRNAPAPLICVSAASPGAGKSLLVDVTSRVLTGAPPELRPYNPRDPNEWGKRLTSFVRAGAPISVFDNIAGPFGDALLDQLVTASTWSDRVLGASEAPPCPVVTTWWATGNNLEPVRDTIRRVLMVRLEVLEERPQERQGFRHPKLQRYADEKRSELLTAALTILRAYHCAGRPRQDLPEWGSFESWSDLVRGALVWLGLPDPFLTQRRTADEYGDAETEQHDFWISTIDESDGSPAEIARRANERGASEVLGVRESITAFTLRKFVARFVDRPRRGVRIRKDAGHFIVESLANSSGSNRASEPAKVV